MGWCCFGLPRRCLNHEDKAQQVHVELPIKKARAKNKDQHVTKADRVHMNSCTASQCGRCKWTRLGAKWLTIFLLDLLNPGYGSWISVRDDDEGWRLGCECCSAARNKGSLAEFTVTTYDGLQNCNFRKHQSNPNHKAAAAEYVTCHRVAGKVGFNVAPPEEFFAELIQSILDGKSSCSDKKSAKAVWCLHESIRAMDRKFLGQAEKITLFRDERKARLALRFRAVKKDLSVRTGTFGQERNFGTGASNITEATVNIIKRLCTSFQGCRHNVWGIKAKLNKKLWKHIRNHVFMMTVDAASDEVLSAEMMRCGRLFGKGSTLFKALQFVLRDKTHASRRLSWASHCHICITYIKLFGARFIACARHILPERPPTKREITKT